VHRRQQRCGGDLVKKIIAATALGGALFATALLGAGAAAAAPSHGDIGYLELLTNDGFSIVDTAQTLRHGHWICDQLFGAGLSPVAVINQVIGYQAAAGDPYTNKNASADVVDAVYALCPQYLPGLSTPSQPEVPATPSAPSETV
jgi:hypothetical protein